MFWREALGKIEHFVFIFKVKSLMFWREALGKFEHFVSNFKVKPLMLWRKLWENEVFCLGF